ncbi:MAG: hypothetical protein CMF25_05680 [Kangiellaceae bacterium]|nr:hypothetical protein [Kangiellaceae bacterium]
MDTLSPKLDLLFKRIFAAEDNKLCLIDLLNALFENTDTPLITDVTVINPHIDPDHIGDKAAVLDIKAVTNLGQRINIEMQMHNHRDMIPRSLFYWSSLFAKQLKQGENYRKLQPTYAINFLNYRQFDDNEPLNHFMLTDKKTGHVLTSLMGLYFIELPKYQSSQHLNQHLVDWLTFLETEDDTVREKLAEKNPAIKKAEDTLKYISQDEKERWLYADRYKAIMDYESDMEGSREEGISIGIDKGRLAEKEDTARALLSAGQSIEFTANITGLSLDTLQQLQQDLRHH